MSDREVDQALDEEIRGLLTLCFPSDSRFRSQRYFQEPPFRRWLVQDRTGNLVAQSALHVKVIGSERGDLTIGGVAEVAVHPDHRGQGLVREMLRDVHDWLKARADFAMLFGSARVYSSSGYVSINNIIRCTAPVTGERVERAFEHAMIRPISGLRWPDGLIDLRGPTF
jgi:GNAT superfamily N-acetyltransferase